MSGTDAGLHGMVGAVRSPISPPPVPGIIDGSMTIHPESGGGISIRVVIGAAADPGGQCSLIELIIGTEQTRELAQAVAAGAGSRRSLPCHIGFGQHPATTTAA
jgi:hypothetical protein